MSTREQEVKPEESTWGTSSVPSSATKEYMPRENNQEDEFNRS